MKKIILGLTLLFLFFYFFPKPAVNAIYFKSGDQVTIVNDELLKGTVMVAGQRVVVNNPIKGDLFCAGQNIEINGQVDGDVICAGQSITINGRVLGSVRIGGQNLGINGTIDRNVTAAGQYLMIAKDIGGDVVFGGQLLTLNSNVNRDLLVGAEGVEINGRVEGDANLYVEKLKYGQGALIVGKTVYQQPKKSPVVKQKAYPSIPAPNNWLGGKIASWLINLIAGLLLILIWPKPIEKSIILMAVNTGKAFGRGALILFVTPLIILAMVITLIGIPFAVILAIVYSLTILLGRILTAIMIGKKIIEQYGNKKNISLNRAAIIGISVAWIIFSIPGLGGLISFVAVLWGLGGVYFLFRPKSVN